MSLVMPTRQEGAALRPLFVIRRAIGTDSNWMRRAASPIIGKSVASLLDSQWLADTLRMRRRPLGL